MVDLMKVYNVWYDAILFLVIWKYAHQIQKNYTQKKKKDFQTHNPNKGTEEKHLKINKF